RVLVVVDQFEEVFTLCENEELRHAFIANLLEAAHARRGQTIVVVTMRSDFYGRCASYPELASAVSEQQVLVSPMSESELRRAIEVPAKLVGCEIEPGLLERLTHLMKEQPGALPLLQHALFELWKYRDGR